MRAAIRMLTPLGWAIVAVAVVVVGLAALGGLGFRWDPFGRTERRLQAAEAEAAAGREEAAARRLETEAASGQLRRLDDFHNQRTAAGRATAAVVEQARSADDAQTPLEDSRADRLRGHDRELCRLAPDLAGCAGAAGAAGGGDPALRPGDAAG